MATPVTLPRQGQSVETCIITSWLKKKGEKVRSGDLLFSYETDKAAFEMEAPADGILLDIFFNEGDEVPVLTNVAVIGTAGEKTELYRPGGDVKKEKQVSGQKEESSWGTVATAGINEHAVTDKIKISPRARILAEEKGISFISVAGSGPGGRIIVRDIEEIVSGSRFQVPGKKNQSGSNQEPATGYTDLPLSNVRKLIAKAMHSSLQNSAQLTHHMSADVRRLLDVRKMIKNNKAKSINGPDITLNDMVCWCIIKALKKFPEINSHFLEDRIRIFNNVNLGLAVDTPRGLIVAAVKNADIMDLPELSKELRSVAESCRKGNISPELIQSNAASFTVSNLGNYGVEMFTPVINLPQTGILGVCTIMHRPADLGNSIFGFIPVMGLSLTYDHRAVDGGPATLFLKEIKEQIERFEYK